MHKYIYFTICILIVTRVQRVETFSLSALCSKLKALWIRKNLIWLLCVLMISNSKFSHTLSLYLPLSLSRGLLFWFMPRTKNKKRFFQNSQRFHDLNSWVFIASYKFSFFFFIANQLSILHYNERPHNLLNLTWVHRPLIVHDVIPRFVFYFATFYLSPTCFLDISTRMSVCACVCVCMFFVYSLCVYVCMSPDNPKAASFTLSTLGCSELCMKRQKCKRTLGNSVFYT